MVICRVVHRCCRWSVFSRAASFRVSATTTLPYTTHLCITLEWHPSHTGVDCIDSQLEHNCVTKQVEPVKSHGRPFADLSIAAVVDMDTALLHPPGFPPPPHCNTPHTCVYNGVAPLTYCTAVCHHTELHHTLAFKPKAAPLPRLEPSHTGTSRTDEVTRMVSCRVVHRCCR